MKMEPQIRKSDHTPPKMAKFGGQKSENEGPQKKAFPESIWTRTFCKKTDPNWSFLASAAPFTIYTPPIGGYHRVLDFTTQITEKYSTAMCYCVSGNVFNPSLNAYMTFIAAISFDKYIFM